MAQTLLQLVQNFALETGLFASPTAVASSADNGILQAQALLNAAGGEIAREYDWQALVKQNIFTMPAAVTFTGDTVLGSSTITNASINLTSYGTGVFAITGIGLNQGVYVNSTTSSTAVCSQPASSTATGTTFSLFKVKYAMPSDYDRKIDRTDWDKSRHWEMLGPETAQQWEWLLSGYIASGPRIRYRIFGAYFQIWPPNSNSDTLGFEYVSNAWAASVSGTAQTSMTSDTDTCIFPDRLMVLALKRKMWEIKGFDTTAIERDYQTQLNIAKANDAGSPSLSMAPRISSSLIGWQNIPDTGFGPP